MRLVPVPIAFHQNVEEGMNYAELSSLTTHDGLEAKECCRLLTYIVIQLINRKNSDETLAEILDKVGVEFKTCCKSVEYLAKSL